MTAQLDLFGNVIESVIDDYRETYDPEPPACYTCAHLALVAGLGPYRCKLFRAPVDADFGTCSNHKEKNV